MALVNPAVLNAACYIAYRSLQALATLTVYTT